jgi:glycine cleavage system H protein
VIRLTATCAACRQLYIMKSPGITDATRETLYFTKDHEWIDFQDPIAYVGVCAFKLTGFKQIDQVCFHHRLGFHKRGEIIASIYYKDYQVDCHMPVDGKISLVNEYIQAEYKDQLLEPETKGWLIQIIPSVPEGRDGLLLPGQYRLNGKRKYYTPVKSK